MATLQSAGVSVSVIDESFYTPAGAGTVPMIFVATEQDKANGSGSGTAQGTTAANAGKVWVITSQRDLTDTFGTPYFETDAEGNPVHAGELNEYGLQTAYSALGVSSKAYIVRADVNTAELVPNGTVPNGEPVNGTYWLATSDTLLGINEWNASTGKFTLKTPLIINDDNYDTKYSTNAPVATFGVVGDYAAVITSDNGTSVDNEIFYKSSSTGWTSVTDGFNSGKKVRLSAHYDYPNFTNTGTGALNAATGSVWIKTTTPSKGANWDVKRYSSTKGTWDRVTAPLYNSKWEAIAGFDSTTGGAGVPLGTVFVEYDGNEAKKANFRLWIRYKTTPTTLSFSATAATSVDYEFYVKETGTDGTFASKVLFAASGNHSMPVAKRIHLAISSTAGLNYVTSSWDDATNTWKLTHTLGGEIQLIAKTNQPFNDISTGFEEGLVANLYVAPDQATDGPDWEISNWKPLVYEALDVAPTTAPADGQMWFDSTLDVDIMYNDGTNWIGYGNQFPSADPLGPIVSASAPTTQQDGIASLVLGDIWIDTSEPEMYGKNVYVYDGSAWALQDVTDHDTNEGWVFADARWAAAGTDDMPESIEALLVSDYVDPDCPDPKLYPRGTRLWNTRRSGNNVKKYHAGYINTASTNPRQGDESMVDYFANRWVTASPNDEKHVGQFGRHAQRSVVVKALKALVTSNQAIRDTDTLVFNLIACPGYPELMQNMVEFNVDNGETALVLGDTPFRLPATGTALTEYGKNTSLEVDNNDSAAVTYNTGLAMFYPMGYTNDNLGNAIVVPPSHMMLRTIINNDNKAYLWFAPAGTRRGTIDNASSVGYIDSSSGEFKTTSLHQGLRDVLQDPGVAINPIATLPGVGLVNMGQRTRAPNSSALDRINVSRLIAYLRRQLAILAKPFLFEPNDSQTRNEVKSAVDALLSELVSQRALYDFLVVCDNSNNTPARIDRSELWIDIAIEPVKAVEFIYIPLRILNTGAIAGLSK